MAIYLKVEQVNFPSEDLFLDGSIDPLSSVIDANVDFYTSANMESDNTNIIETNEDVRDQSSSPTSDINRRLRDLDQSENLPESNDANKHIDSHPESALGEDASNYPMNYPSISLPVAQYINETNPEWCTEAQKYLKLTELSKLPVNCRSSADLPISPFCSMTATTEALALQHSVIGNKDVKPVSADIVAEVVARTQLRFQQQQQSSGMDIGQNQLYRENPSKHPMKSSEFITHSSPPNMGVYVSSKVPNTFSSSKDCIVDESRRSSISSISSIVSKKGNRAANNIPTVHVSRSKKIQKTCNNGLMSKSTFSLHSDFVADSETESCFSEQLELESVCSDAFETESNISEVSGFGEDLIQLKHILERVSNNDNATNCNNAVNSNSDEADQKTSPSKARMHSQVFMKEEGMQTESSELFEIMREKANLEGQLECVTKSEIDLSKECTSMHSTIVILQTQIDALKKQCGKVSSEKQNALAKIEFLNEQQDKWDNVLKEYQNIIEGKNIEIKALKDDVSESEQSNIQARINFEELKVDIESRDAAVIGLKKKIAELHCEVQLLLQSKVQLQNDVRGVQHEMETLEKSRDWYKDQLHTTQESRDQLHKDLILLQSKQVTSSNDLEKSRTEVSHLKQQLSESQQRAVGEKKVLMNHLENIEADMMERESLFEEMQKDKGSVESLLLDRAKRMEEERSKITHLSFTVSDLEYQLSLVKSDIFEKDKSIFALEKEKAELCRQVALLQKMVNDKDLSVQQITQNLKDANSKILHIESSLKSSEGLVESMKSEKNAAEMSLASANDEKRTVNESLMILKDNLHRVESNFKQMKAELVAKTSKISQLLKENSVLETSLKVLEEKTVCEQKTYEQEMSRGKQICHVMVDDLKKQKHDIENVLGVYSKDLLQHQQQIQLLESERNNLKVEVETLKKSGIDMVNKWQILEMENNKLHKDIVSLNEHIAVSKEVSAEAEKSHNNSLKDGVNGADHFQRIQTEYSQKLRVYKSNIKILTRKLKEKFQQCESLNAEVKSLREKEDSTLNSTELSVEQGLLDQQTENAQLKDELLSLRDNNRIHQERIQENEKIIMQLEKERGKIAAISNNNEALKSKISELESQVADKDAASSQLISQLAAKEADFKEQHASVQARLHSLEEDMKKEKILVKSLRQQIFQEKRANSHLQKQLDSLKTGVELANQSAEAKKKEISILQSELELNLQTELKVRESTEALQAKCQSHQSEIEKLKKELCEVTARDPALAQQLKSLSWHLKEKSNEIAATKEKQNLLEERHIMEIDSLKKAIQNSHTDLESYKAEMDEVRKQKFHFQSQLVQLRKAFKSNLGSLMNLNHGEKSNNNSLFELSKSSFDESYVNSLLEKSLLVPESKPLNHLQACLNSLKQEMAELQKQLCDNLETAS